MTLDETFKAAKAGDLTNDTTYKVGEISRKTGLQKQPDGSWAPPKGQRKSGGAGIPKADEKTFIGKTFKDFSESARASGYKPAKETENPDGSSSTFFSNGDKQIRVDFDKSGKILKVQKETENPVASSEENSTMAQAKAIADNEKKTQAEGKAYLQQSVSGYSDQSLKQAESTYKRNLEEFDDDIKSLQRRDLAPAQIAKRINSANFAKGALKAINAEIENRAKKNNPDRSQEPKRTDNTTGKDYKEGQTVPQAAAMQKTMKHREKLAMQAYSKLKQEGASHDETYAAAQLVRSSRDLGELLRIIAKDPEDPLNEATAEKLNSMLKEHDQLQKEVDNIKERRTVNRDAAPRQLTGDCKIRLTNDTTYKVGEISRKTGLQKQPDGSWAPPKQTRYGKVTTNKNGEVGIQQTLGKGSKFEKFGSEKEASRALGNYTAGYNTTERSKEDPHSNEALLHKHWDKEVEKIRKENKAERRAAHAAQFMNKPEQKPSAVSSEAKPAVMPGFNEASAKEMTKLGFKQEGNSWIREQNGHKQELKVQHQPGNEFINSYTTATLYIDGDKRPYTFGGGETIDPNSIQKLKKILK